MDDGGDGGDGVREGITLFLLLFYQFSREKQEGHVIIPTIIIIYPIAIGVTAVTAITQLNHKIVLLSFSFSTRVF